MLFHTPAAVFRFGTVALTIMYTLAAPVVRGSNELEPRHIGSSSLAPPPTPPPGGLNPQDFAPSAPLPWDEIPLRSPSPSWQPNSPIHWDHPGSPSHWDHPGSPAPRDHPGSPVLRQSSPPEDSTPSSPNRLSSSPPRQSSLPLPTPSAQHTTSPTADKAESADSTLRRSTRLRVKKWNLSPLLQLPAATSPRRRLARSKSMSRGGKSPGQFGDQGSPPADQGGKSLGQFGGQGSPPADQAGAAQKRVSQNEWASMLS